MGGIHGAVVCFSERTGGEVGLLHGPQGCGWGHGAVASVDLATFLLALSPPPPVSFSETGLQLSGEGGSPCQLGL